MTKSSTVSSVASPICQEGQSERNFPIFAFSSRFFLNFSQFFPDFFADRGGTLPPLATPVATPLSTVYFIFPATFSFSLWRCSHP